MNIIEPKVELLIQKNPIDHVANCAHICYASSFKDHDSNVKFYNGLRKAQHMSMFRHETHYYIVPQDSADTDLITWIESYYMTNHPYVNINKHLGEWYIVLNGQFVKENVGFAHMIFQYKVDSDYFAHTDIGFNMMRYTFVLTTQISTTRELNRVSPNNIAEMSTRYIKFGGRVEPTIVRPHWIGNDFDADKEYFSICEKAFDTYEILLNSGTKPEDARGILPLDTMTKVVYTYSIDEWKRIIDLRYYGTTGKPHPNAKIIIGMVRNELNKLKYNL